MSFLTAVPLVFGYPAHIWLGLILFILIVIQITTGIMMVKVNMKYFKIHRINFILIVSVMLGHMYWGLGLWFFHFTIK
ncbi:MAG: hypothetical protein WC460_05120 [Patescibacteria group bacterium]